jgi:hypothetical protein
MPDIDVLVGQPKVVSQTLRENARQYLAELEAKYEAYRAASGNLAEFRERERLSRQGAPRAGGRDRGRRVEARDQEVGASHGGDAPAAPEE